MAKIQYIILFALLILLSACSGEQKNAEEKTETERVRTSVVETTVLQKTQYSDYIRLTGSLEAGEDAMVAAQTSGRVLSIVERGKILRRGEVIAELDNEIQQAQFNMAKANFDLAKDMFTRNEPLHADSIITSLEFNQIKAQFEQAEAQFNQARRQLNDTRITAPFSGRVEERMVRAGELLNPGMPVIRLVNTTRVKVAGGIPERYALEVKEGTPVVVDISSYGGGLMNAKVTYTGSVIDPGSRTLPVEIEIPNPEGILKPEMMVRLQITRQVLDDVITVPRTALIRNEDGLSIFVASIENNHKVARLVNVTAAQSSGNRVIISEGLSEGDEVVIVGQTILNEGDRLNVVRVHEYNIPNSGNTAQASR